VPRTRQLIRDFHAGQYVDLFLVSAVSAILVIRVFLHLTGYPQVGGESLHIAHMLWGGLLMLAALILVFSYIGRRTLQIAAFVGGVGFGTFIDEVGKFVTQDNDYFYQPAVALIYVTFILLYLAIRSIHGTRPRPEEYLINALQEIENLALNDLDREERDRALLLLKQADPGDPLVAALRNVLDRAELVPTPDPHPIVRVRNAATALYKRVIAIPAFPTILIGFFVVQLVLKLVHIVAMWIWHDWRISLAPTLPPIARVVEGLGFVDWAQLASALLSAAFVALGIAAIRTSRLRAFQMFQRSILVSIFITQVFMFYREEWGALLVLAFNLLVFAALSFMIEHESLRLTSLQSASGEADFAVGSGSARERAVHAP
jgi:hypothetical protein